MIKQRKTGNVMKRYQRVKNGFTLIEVAVALAVLAIGLTSILAVITTGLRWSGEIRSGNMAAMMVRAAAVYDVTATDSSFGSTPNGCKVTRSETTVGADKTRTVTVQSLDAEETYIQMTTYLTISSS